jgi:hypothetical protein
MFHSVRLARAARRASNGEFITGRGGIDIAQVN